MEIKISKKENEVLKVMTLLELLRKLITMKKDGVIKVVTDLDSWELKL